MTRYPVTKLGEPMPFSVRDRIILAAANWLLRRGSERLRTVLTAVNQEGLAAVEKQARLHDVEGLWYDKTDAGRVFNVDWSDGYIARGILAEADTGWRGGLAMPVWALKRNYQREPHLLGVWFDKFIPGRTFTVNTTDGHTVYGVGHTARTISPPDHYSMPVQTLKTRYQREPVE